MTQNPIRRLGIVLAFVLSSCSGSSTEIPFALSVNDLTETEQDQIAEFVFIVSNDSNEGRAYPRACIRNLEGGASGATCFDTSCDSFSASESEFSLEVPTSLFPQGENVTLTACALGAPQGGNVSVLASGAQTFANQETSGITIVNLTTDDVSFCQLTLPATVCP